MTFAALLICPRGSWDSCLNLALTKSEGLEKLTLLADRSDLDDARLAVLGHFMANVKSLKDLQLGFFSCHRFTQLGLKTFVIAVAQLELAKVELDIMGCRNVEDLSIKSLEDLRRSADGQALV